MSDALLNFLDTAVIDELSGKSRKLGHYRFGVYAFYDYDGEPIYVGQTTKRLRTSIHQHLTSQISAAVTLNVLDPFEVLSVAVWPLPQFQHRRPNDPEAKAVLDALEFAVFHELLGYSRFGALLNEKEPPRPVVSVDIPRRYFGRIVSDEVFQLRSHPDIRIARQAATLSKLAQVISERRVSSGLRKTLRTQAARLAWLAAERHRALAHRGSPGGEASRKPDPTRLAAALR
jgi:hypothetical protein